MNLFFIVLSLVLLGSSIATVRTENHGQLSIRINRTVKIENGGSIIINDTIFLSTNSSGTTFSLTSFQIGIPSEYLGKLAYFFAYDSSGERNVSLNNLLDDGLGIFTIFFPEGINIDEETQYNLTMISVFSDLVKSELLFYFKIDFPFYPSLIQDSEIYNLEVVLPSGAIFLNSSHTFDLSSADGHTVLQFSESSLQSLANSSAWIIFDASEYQLVDIEEVTKEIYLSGQQDIHVSESYLITNKAERDLLEFSMLLPENSTKISVQDPYGHRPISVDTSEQFPKLTISLLGFQTSRILITYILPFQTYVSQNKFENFMVDISFPKVETGIMASLVLRIHMPEGANLQSSNYIMSYFEKELFQEVLTIRRENVTSLDSQELHLEYYFGFLWSSFRPTLLIEILVALIFSVPLLAMKSPSPITTFTTVPSASIRNFLQNLEGKRKIKSDLKSLQSHVGKGRISRRKYKQKRSSLAANLSRIERKLAQLRKQIEASGEPFSRLMKQLEVAEADLETLERDIININERYRRREVSSQTRQSLLGEYNQRREKTENSIAEIHFRLKEEIQ